MDIVGQFGGMKDKRSQVQVMGRVLREGTHQEGSWKRVTQEMLAPWPRVCLCWSMLRLKMMLECVLEVSWTEFLLKVHSKLRRCPDSH